MKSRSEQVQDGLDTRRNTQPASLAGPSAVDEVKEAFSPRRMDIYATEVLALRHAEELDQWRRLGLIPSDVAQELTVCAPA